MTTERNKTDIRFITCKGREYLRKEDVVEYIQKHADTEETDTRNRWQEVAEQISHLGESNLEKKRKK